MAGWYVTYDCFPGVPRPSLNEINIASFDPGITHFAIRVEKRFYVLPPPSHPLNPSNPPQTPLLRVSTLLMEMINLQGYNIYENLTYYLDIHYDLLSSCSMFVMERQMIQNPDVFRIAQHIVSYFHIRIAYSPLKPIFFEIDPKIRNHIGYDGKLSNHRTGDIKSWSVKRCLEILTEYGDDTGMAIMDKIGKRKHDLADTVCQVEALWRYLELTSP